ncbi:FIST signal transduction protein [Allonocardiopsis opalescens]|uniref:Small ligand-binding sensory domain FIST n=1 Tax=Allonocardiopsis opalescens TaxID=1144618 RepID=A0A2T0QD83_9ACTN|nr:FIST N-terminal domain-containing protein [Allonocardiopsis opalescens]PRY01879.1 small ligand-binding sensory domain FIST [Allonocardiopsis opalescens]
MNRFGTGLATGADLVGAAERAVREAVFGLEEMPDLLTVFVSGGSPEDVEAAARRAMELSGAGTILGCTAVGVLGGDRAVENEGAVSVWAARLPGTRLVPFELTTVRDDDHLAVLGMAEPGPDDQVAVILADPYDFPADAFVEETTEALGGMPLVGGLADSPIGGEGVRLFLNGRVLRGGAVGVLLGGEGVLGATVSQGCRPIGPPMVVTRAEGNVVLELAGVPALEKLESIVNGLPPAEQELAALGLHIGVAMDEYADRHEHGDFLIRAVAGAEGDETALLLGSLVSVGQTVRFQVRDAATAETDLRERLLRFTKNAALRPGGALLFTCNGRGSAMFDSTGHDPALVRQTLGVDAVGGFFGAGEIGPVAGRNHVHGFTACVLAFA